MKYILPLLYGIGTGFLMSVLLGVIFFMLIQVGLKHHWKKGFTIAAGVISGDILFVILAIGFTGLIQQFLESNGTIISFSGGIVLLIMAATTFIQGRGNIGISENASGLQHARDFYLKPFVINILNPANAAWWLGLYSIPPALDYTLTQKILFAVGAISTIFFTEVGVAFGASKLKNLLTKKLLKRVDYVVGTALVFFGLRLIIKALGWV